MKNSDLVIQAQNTFNTLIDLLTELKWEYLKNDEELSITCILTGHDFPVPVQIVCDKLRGIVNVSSQLSFKVPSFMKDEIAMAVCMINAVLDEGGFDYDYDLGKILFRVGLVYKDCVVSREALLHLIRLVLIVVDEYNDKLFTVSRGLYDLCALDEYLTNGV